MVNPSEPKKQRGGARIGAGRKGKGYVRRKMTVSLPPEYWEKFDSMTAYLQQDQAALVRSMMMAFIDQWSNESDLVDCPVCSGQGEIQPKALPSAIVCPGCSGAKKLQQVKIKIE
jgi:hypothetical protein